MKKLIVIRHGEAYKNLKNIDGGKGTTLTEQGKTQVLKKCELLISNSVVDDNSIMYVSTDRIQILETASIIQKELSISKVCKSKLYSPIDLGVLDGMPKDRQKQLYPEAIEKLEQWNEGLCDINEFKVEGLQDAEEYYLQLKEFIENLEDNRSYVLVGTRSDISALKNVVLGNNPKEKMKYKYYPTDYAEGFIVEMDEKNKFKIIESIQESKENDINER